MSGTEYEGWLSGVGGAIAGNASEGTFLPLQLFAGEAPITTASGMVPAGLNIAAYTVIGRRADGFNRAKRWRL